MNEKTASCGCGGGNENTIMFTPGSGTVSTPAGDIPAVGSTLCICDTLSNWKVRWGFGRMTHTITPGLYALNGPTTESPVLVTANYKLSFDSLRKELTGRPAWILALDTKGINVWCAAGKGTFGTQELITQVEKTRLAEVVSHRLLILPQLGAPGVAAHTAERFTRFKIIYGPVRAADLPAFLDAQNTATPEMRHVTFNLAERLAVIPVELTMTSWMLGLLVLTGGILSWLTRGTLGVQTLLDTLPLAAAWFGGVVLSPALLPWLPGRAFSVKGTWIGLAMAVSACLLYQGPLSLKLAWLLIMPAVSAFFAMNYTGSSTFTPQTGVMREVKRAIPLMIAFTGAGMLSAFAGLITRLI